MDIKEKQCSLLNNMECGNINEEKQMTIYTKAMVNYRVIVSLAWSTSLCVNLIKTYYDSVGCLTESYSANLKSYVWIFKTFIPEISMRDSFLSSWEMPLCFCVHTRISEGQCLSILSAMKQSSFMEHILSIVFYR